MTTKKIKAINILAHQLNLTNYIPWLTANVPKKDFNKVEQLTDIIFSFYPAYRKDINEWLREINHPLREEKMHGKNTVTFLSKNGAVEFKLRFIGT
jgi:hypothetical protein